MSYLFLAIPNFCGSTLVHSLLKTVPEVVSLIPPKETIKFFGQKSDFTEGNVCAYNGYRNLNGPHSIEANMEHVYSDSNNYDWNYIKGKWHENWANSNPYGTIFMQKTPADIFRINMMLPYFPECKWILSVRNPYTYVESIFRKATFRMEPIRQLDQICFHVLRTMEIQLENKRLLKDAAYVMTYESFANDPKYHVNAMAEWMPELSQIDLKSSFLVKGVRQDSIMNNNEARFDAFTSVIPGILNKINQYFIPMEHLINQWGYEIK